MPRGSNFRWCGRAASRFDGDLVKRCALRSAPQAARWTISGGFYRPLADAWVLYDNSGAQPVLLEWGETE